MEKQCPYNYVAVNKQLERYDCSEDCIIQQKVAELHAELESVKETIKQQNKDMGVAVHRATDAIQINRKLQAENARLVAELRNAKEHIVEALKGK